MLTCTLALRLKLLFSLLELGHPRSHADAVFHVLAHYGTHCFQVTDTAASECGDGVPGWGGGRGVWD